MEFTIILSTEHCKKIEPESMEWRGVVIYLRGKWKPCTF